MPNEVVANDPIAQIESAISESTTEVVEAITTAEATEEQHWEKLADLVADRVADRVYEKTKKFVDELLTATEDAAAMALEHTEAPPETEVPESTTEEEQEDIKPRRAHPLFRKPGKKEE
jgi:hypothetical protein